MDHYIPLFSLPPKGHSFGPIETHEQNVNKVLDTTVFPQKVSSYFWRTSGQPNLFSWHCECHKAWCLWIQREWSGTHMDWTKKLFKNTLLCWGVAGKISPVSEVRSYTVLLNIERCICFFSEKFACYMSIRFVLKKKIQSSHAGSEPVRKIFLSSRSYELVQRRPGSD